MIEGCRHTQTDRLSTDRHWEKTIAKGNTVIDFAEREEEETEDNLWQVFN